MDLIPSEKIEPIIFKLLCSDPKYATLLSEIYEKEWMHDSNLGRIIEVVIKYYKKNNTLPKFSTVELIVSKLFPDNYSEIIVKLKSANDIDISLYDKEYLDDEIMKYLRNCGIYWTIMSNVEEVSKTHSVANMIDTLKNLTTMNFDFDLGLDYIEDIENHCNELIKPDSRLPTGWDELDEVMNGGFLSDGKCLAMFMGETHIGKSLILSNLAANMIRNDKFAVIITLEMSENVYASRIDAHLSKVDINSLKYNLDKVKDTANDLKKYPNSKLVIKEFPPDTITCNHIKSYLDKLAALHNRYPDIVIVDYVNLLMPAAKEDSMNSYNKYRIVTTELRKLSYIIPKPVVSVVQCNRGGYNNNDVDLSSVSDSIAIPMICDFVAILFQREGDREAEVLNLKICKNRIGGRIGKILQFHIDYSNLSISDIGSQLKCPNDAANEIMLELDELNQEYKEN